MVEMNKAMFGIMLVVLIAIAAFVRYQFIFAESVWVDETVYMWQGYRVLHSPSLLFTKDYYGNTPFPLIVIAFFNIFTSDRFIAGRLAAYLFALLGITLAYLIGRHLRDEYTGLLAALALTFNPLHWFLGSRTLMDLPEATMVSLSVYLLLRFERNRNLTNLIILALAVTATTLTKLPGLLIVPGIMLYYFSRAVTAPAKALALLRNKHVSLGVGFFGIVILFLAISKFSFILALFKAMEPRLVFIESFPFMFSETIILFIVAGGLLTVFYRKWDSIAILCVFLSFLVAFSLFPAEPDPRHVIPIIPLGIVLAAFAYFELGAIIKPYLNLEYFEIVLFMIGIIIVFPLYKTGVMLNTDKSYVFTGYNEAGQWLAENLPKGALAYVSSQGPIRLFSGLGYSDEGGPIRQIQTFGEGDIPDFANATFPIFLHIDMWERGPQWSYPLNEKKLGYLQSLGFRIAKIVTRKYPTNTGLQDVPVHLMLVKERTKLG